MIGGNRIGTGRLSLPTLAEALEAGRVHVSVGLVTNRGEDGKHFEILKDSYGTPVDVTVEVDLMPRGEPVTARLAAFAGGPGAGLWKVPPAGSEVLVCIPHGEPEAGPVVVAVLSARAVPSALDADAMVMINPGKVIIAATNEKVYLGSQDGTGCQPAVVGDDLETRLSNLESKFNAHVHPAGGLTAPVGGGTVTGSTAATTNTITGPPSIKSATVAVKK